MYGRNSTIKVKFGVCPLCNNDKEVALTKGLCNSHYWQGVRMKSVERQQEREIEHEGLQDLIKEADDVFSKWVRLSAADKDGFIYCYICGKKVRWQDGEAMHYVKRGNLFLRYDPRNVKAGEEDCNRFKYGNYIKYAQKLEQESPGITEILYQEGNIVYKMGRDELKGIITEYSLKLKSLKH